MTLKFVFNPPTRIKVLYWQKISFVASKPFLHFCLKEREEQKQTTTKKVKLESLSLAGIYNYLKALKENNVYPELFDISSSGSKLSSNLTDFNQIMLNLQNGEYKSSQEVQDAINSYLNFVYQNFTSASVSKYRDSAYQAKDEIAKQFSSITPSPGFTPTSLFNALKEFNSLPVQQEEGTEFLIYDVEKLAKILNGMEKEQKRKAEWIIRSNCPTVPYYMRSVDLANLPYSAIDALVSYFNIKI